MESCQHTDWLRLCRGEHSWSITSESRLHRLLSKVQNAASPCPSIAIFVGNKSKDEVLNKAFPRKSLGERSENCFASLHQVCRSSHSPYPLLFADVDFPFKYTNKAKDTKRPRHRKRAKLTYKSRCRKKSNDAEKAATQENCHDATQHDLTWTNGLRDEDVTTTVFSRLLLPFADVVYLFPDDLNASSGTPVAERIRAWTAVQPVTRMTKPRLVIVVVDDSDYKELLHQLLDVMSVAETFASIEILSQGSNMFDFEKNIEMPIDAARMSRRAQGALFAPSHLSALFEKAVKHAARKQHEGLDLIKLSRKYDMVDVSLVSHLKTLHGLCDNGSIPMPEVVENIAAAFVMDHLSPEMHYFNPESVFRTLYRDHVIQSAVDLRGTVKVETFVNSTQKAFEHFCTMVGSGKQNALDLRLAVLGRESQLPAGFLDEYPEHDAGRQGLKDLYSNLTCLFCLRRRPEHVLSCNHALCDKCVQRIYPVAFGMESCYEIQQCVICSQQGALRVKMVPPTASYRTAVFDGGGVRGVVSLELLKAIEATRNLPYSIQDDFDLAVGTSTGGLIVLLLFLERRSVEHCLSSFEQLAGRIFPPNQASGFSFCRKVLEALAALFGSGRYDVNVLEACLEEVYGKDHKLFAVSRAGMSGTKVAVTGLSVRNGELHLFTNYNGESTRSNTGYKHVRSDRMDDEVLIREAAQATSAAPSIFPPKHIKALNCSVQDGGIGMFNNPIRPAKWEAKVLWPKTKDPDLVLSFGTGFVRVSGCSNLIPRGSLLPNTVIARLLPVWLSPSNSEEIWKQFYNGRTKEERRIYHRMNLPLEYLPSLDRSDAMQDLREDAKSHLKSNAETAEIVNTVTNTLLTTQFFFELSNLPVFTKKGWQVSGMIRCRSPNGVAVVYRILEKFPSSVFVWDGDKILGDLRASDVCRSCMLYKKDVAFLVDSVKQPVQIELSLRADNCPPATYPISAFQTPRKIRWFVKRQGLNNPFASSIQLRSECRGVKRGPRGKRKINDGKSEQAPKRRCNSLNRLTC